MTRVVVVGGGAIGGSAAFELRARGHDVVVVRDPTRRPAAWVAAGMLAPVAEAWFGEEELLRIGLESVRCWPDFARHLFERTGIDVGLSRWGSVLVAATERDRSDFNRLVAYHHELGLDVEATSRRALRALEPALAPSVRSGAAIHIDLSVDNRALLAALDATNEIIAARVVNVDGRGVRLDDGTRIDGDLVVVAAGWATRELVAVEVRPVKGEIIRVRGPQLITRTIRGLVDGSKVYLVPRVSGEIVIGATMDEMGANVDVRVGGVYELLRDATTLVPGVKELTFVEVDAGLRPGSPSNEPIVEVIDDVVVATGHFRNGILLAPWTARRVADLVERQIGGNG